MSLPSGGTAQLWEELPPGPERGMALVLHEEAGAPLGEAVVGRLVGAGFSTRRLVAEPRAELVAWLEELLSRETERGHRLALLVGQGAAAPLALALAARSETGLRAVALFGAPAHLEHVGAAAGGALLEPLEAAEGIAVPLLLLHAPEDERVPAHDARLLYRAAPHPKSFLAVPGAGGGFAGPQEVDWAAEMLLAWVGRHVPSVAEPLPHGQVLVAGRETLQNHVLAGRHELLADEPVDLEGFDSGPAPHEFVLSGLGACTSMTLRMYADRKGWPLERVEVDLQIERRPRKEGMRTIVDSTIRRTIRIEGDLDDKQRARLLEIAERCPVHRTLTGTITIESELGG